jgi:hypothetical protein
METLHAAEGVGRRWGATDTVEHLADHDHLSWTFRDPESWRRTLTAFLAGGSPTERLVYTSPDDERSMLADLADLPGASELRRSGRLWLVPHALLPTDEASALHRSAEFASVVDEALAAPCTAVRVATRIASDHLPDDSTQGTGSGVAAFELYADRVISTRPVAALCGADVRLPSTTLDVVQLVHPLRRGGLRAADDAWLFAVDDKVWALAGELDIRNRAASTDALSSLRHAHRVANPDADCHLDLRHLEFIDIRGMGTLVDLARDLAPAQLVLHNAAGLLRKVLDELWPSAMSPGIRIATTS